LERRTNTCLAGSVAAARLLKATFRTQG